MAHLRDEFPVYSREQGLDQRIEYSGGNPIYVGRALPGTADSVAKWQIYKMQWDSGSMTHLRWADAVDEFIKTWNNRTTYNYLDI